jgi:hypothetical protein
MYHDFKDYLSGLLSRRDVEAVMDEACDDLMDSINSPLPPFVKNPFEAQFLRSFGGPKPETLFINRGEEGRYAFALHVDFFNPEGMNVRGASTSCGIISMACLNLPLDIRYKPENMYLAGIIPGPKQPSLENLNHYIRPLMNDLVDAWERGIKFSKTACYPNGRLTRCAVALVICDLPAARHLSCLAGVSSHFYCSACDCYHKSTYGRVDFENWTPRDRDKLRAYAEQWRDAATSAEREALFKAHGVRYSELWRLPYWDPSRQLVIDLMHCLLEGLVPHHTCNLLGLTSKSTASASTPLAFSYDFGEVPSGTMTTKEMTQVSTIQALLLSQMIIPDEEACFNKLKDSLFHKNIGLLKYICNNLGCMPQKTGRTFKIDYVKALLEWVSSLSSCYCPKFLNDYSQRRGKPLTAPIEEPQFGTAEVLGRIRDVIRDASVPTWLGSVPSDFGDASAGTLKADEWRSLITVYLPIALVSLWGAGTSHASDELSVRLRSVLDHTMELVCAVYLACARTMTARRANAYCSYISGYVGKLKEIHPTFALRPNHHASFHLYDFLLLFGPAHSWWCFPFERLIGILQRLPVNHKFGQSLSEY